MKIKFDDKINTKPNNKVNQQVTKGYNALKDDLMKYLLDSWWQFLFYLHHNFYIMQEKN